MSPSTNPGLLLYLYKDLEQLRRVATPWEVVSGGLLCSRGDGVVLLPGRAEQTREYQLLAHPGVTELSKQAPEDIHDYVQTPPEMIHLNLLRLGYRHPSFFLMTLSGGS